MGELKGDVGTVDGQLEVGEFGENNPSIGLAASGACPRLLAAREQEPEVNQLVGNAEYGDEVGDRLVPICETVMDVVEEC